MGVNSQDLDADVIIVGYGPSGVSAANFLGALGVKAIAIERDRDVYPRARAVTCSDWTLRCYQSVGLDQDLLAVMETTTALRWITYHRRELMRLHLPPSTLGQPVSSNIYQPAMEAVLRRGAERFSDCVEVRFGQELTAVTQDAQSVTAAYRDVVTGATKSITARYLLACDGGASTVRAQTGVKLIGETIDTKWVVIDARVKRWWPERHLLTFWSDSERPVVDIPLALGNHRWEFPLRAGETEENFATRDQLWELLSTMGVTPEHVEIHQHAFYKHHVRHAERWRVGRAFLLGYAAHLMPPWAGQGMQSGIRDAHNISWKVAAVLRGVLPDSVLDSYEIERAPNVAYFTQLSERLGRVIKMQMTGPEKLEALTTLLRRKLGLPLPPSPLSYLPKIEAGWLRGSAGAGSAVGRMIPQPGVANAQGKQAPLDHYLGNGFVILGLEQDPAALLSPAERQAWDRLGARYLTVRAGASAAQADTDLFDLEGTLTDFLNRHRTRAVAVRPDRFVAAADGSGLGVPAQIARSPSQYPVELSGG